MLLILRLFFNIIHEALITDKGIDPRTANYPLTARPWWPFTIILGYLLFVLKFGPEWMKDRKPYDVKNIVSLYNAFQVLINLAVSSVLCYSIYMDENFSFICMPLSTGRTDHYTMLVVNFTYFFYLSKYLDLFDTVFFILKKKDQQKSFLHVYHHTAIALVGYYGVRFYAASQATITTLINSIVHAVMYSYYFCTSVYPHLKTKIWWKKYLTLMQIIQFFISGIHFGVLPLVVKDCDFPMPVCVFSTIQFCFLTAMFSDFYYKAYIRPKKVVKTQ